MEYLPILISGPFGGGISIVARVISESNRQIIICLANF
jgi:methylglyoxal synthase